MYFKTEPRSDFGSQEYIRAKADITVSDCWLWKGQYDKDGYGKYRLSTKSPWTKAHRASFIAFKGSIPDGLLVLHHCDNRSCVNPEHLYVGTANNNYQDMITRNRRVENLVGLVASREKRRKLTPTLITQVRTAYKNKGITRNQLASSFGVSKATIDRALRR
jgi:hypothetical protein